ncbi:MAG TPA: hypothetical protein VFZ78_05250, partial [Flavisolibacter sp.]
EGKNSAYLFFSDEALYTNTTGKVTGAVISRSINGAAFREIGKLQAAGSPAEFNNIVGAGALRKIQALKNLSSEQEAWQYVRSHPKLSDYGIFAAEVNFMIAMGAVFVDNNLGNIPAASTIRYRAQVTTAGSAQQQSLESTITMGSVPAIQKPVVSMVSENDTTVIINWTASVRESADAMFGEIYRKKGNYGPFEFVGRTMANKDQRQQTITYSWYDKVQPDIQFYYVVVPVTLVGLPGPASDTASAISRNFRGIDQASFMTATDTTSGISLKWNEINTTYFSGLVIERSKDPKSGYATLDTIASGQTYYLDDRILPNIQYHYRIRMITLRHQVLEPSAFASAIHKGMNSFIEAPEDLRADGNRVGIRLAWKRTRDPQVAGYYVYRMHPDSTGWDLVSNLVADSSFFDSSARNSRFQYRYTVRAVNFDDVKSEQSNIAFARADTPAEVIAPTGLQVAADGQRVLLRWNDTRQSDHQVLGFNVYRRKGSGNAPSDMSAAGLMRAGYEKVNEPPVAVSAYTDNAVSAGSYQYTVTAADAFGKESDATAILPVVVDPAMVPPVAEIYARSVKNGIVVSWDAPVQQGITGYAVYRRTPDKSAYERIATIPAAQLSYTDTKAQKGSLYFYIVKTIAGNTESVGSGEKGVRW